MFELGTRPREDLPGFVAMAAENHEIVGCGGAQCRQGFSVAPTVGRDEPDAAGAARAERKCFRTGRVLERGESLTGEDMGVA
jgi:hypothetical protein